MVNKLFFLIVAALLSNTFLSADTSNIFITSVIDEYQAYENQPLKGTITVTHDKTDKVDTSTFLLDKKPVRVEFIKDVEISSNSPLVISYYSFEFPAQPAGLYVLPEVSVKVAGNVYRSVMSSYQVQGADEKKVQPVPPPQPNLSPATVPASSNSTPASSSPSSAGQAAAPTLKLEAIIESKKPFYPGQKAKFVYRYLYNMNFDLTREVLPLLDAQGFIKDGDKESKDYTQNNLTVSEISQAVEAIKPGTYSFGPSIIEGYAYTTDVKGKHIYTSPKQISEAPIISVTVVPFPDKDKPASFNGAVGDYQFKVSLNSLSEITVGDEISLSIEISGKGDLSSVKLPDVCCQPGMSGFFRMSDLPPVGTVKENTKTFIVHMRPLTEAIKEIPGIEFSFFNPDTTSYQVLHTKPIPIVVKAAKTAPVKIPDQSEKSPESTPKPKNYRPSPIEIQSVFSLRSSDLYNKVFGTWWSLAIIPFGIALLIYQISLRDYLEKIRNVVKQRTSGDLLHEALQQPKGSSRYFDLLNQALKLRLFEVGLLKSANTPTDKLPNTGLAGEVRAFLCEIEEHRFSGKGEMAFDLLEGRAKKIFEKSRPMASQIQIQSKGDM